MVESGNSLGMLVGSSVRVQLLSALVRSPQVVTDLENAVDATRRTVLRNLNRLETEGWVRRSGDRYQLVPVAAEFVSELVEYHERANRLQELLIALEYAPKDLLEIPPAVLVECDTIVRQPAGPAAPVRDVVSAIRSASVVLTSVPTVTKQLVDAHETALQRTTEVDVLVGSDGLECIRSSNAIDPSTDLLRSLYVYDEPTEPVGVVCSDDRTILLIFDEYGTIHALISGFHEHLRSWAVRYYEDRRKHSSPIDLPED